MEVFQVRESPFDAGGGHRRVDTSLSVCRRLSDRWRRTWHDRQATSMLTIMALAKRIAKIITDR